MNISKERLFIYTKILPYDSVKQLIKLKCKMDNVNRIAQIAKEPEWKEITTNEELISDIPRKAAVAKFRLLTGHDCLAKDLHKTGMHHISRCIDVTKEEDIVNKYWDTRCKMT